MNQKQRKRWLSLLAALLLLPVLAACGPVVLSPVTAG